MGFTKEINPDNSVSYSVRKENIEFWITSYGSEFSIGFNSKNDCTWHTHMSLFGANTIEEQVIEANKQIDRIINNKIKIVYNMNGILWLDGNSGENSHDGDDSKYWKDF